MSCNFHAHICECIYTNTYHMKMALFVTLYICRSLCKIKFALFMASLSLKSIAFFRIIFLNFSLKGNLAVTFASITGLSENNKIRCYCHYSEIDNIIFHYMFWLISKMSLIEIFQFCFISYSNNLVQYGLKFDISIMTSYD